MKRLTIKECGEARPTSALSSGVLWEIVDRLAAIEDILGDEYELDDLKTAMWCKETVGMAFSEDTDSIERLRELWFADREGRCAVLETDRKKLEIAFNIVVKYGFCGDCKWIFKDKHCLECDCYQNGVKIISNALFGPEAALKARE